MKTLKVVAACALLGASAYAQNSYPGCTDLKASDFKATELFNKTGANGALGKDPTLNEPLQFVTHGVMKNGALDHVDIYFCERGGNKHGAVKHYDGVTHQVTTMGTIDVWGNNDAGLMGMTIDPNFDDNHYVYVWYVPSPNPITAKRHIRFDRIVMKSDFTLDMSTRKNLIDILGSTSDKWHTGGPMVWDAYGDLWIQVGNNSIDISGPAYGYLSKTDSNQSAEWGPSNTANMRGGTLRIHPDDKAPKGYTIPDGNFGQYWADQWDKAGKTALAAQYRDSAKVLPEVYVKGDRSNYSIAVHPTKRWLAYGTVNYESASDEYNIIGHPAFMGFPYFHSHNIATPGLAGAYGSMNPATPMNNNPLSSGVKELPPAMPSEDKVEVNTSIGGPIYVFDPSLKSDIKFPPQMHNTWITFGFKQSRMFVMNLDTVGIHITKQTEVGGTGGLFSALNLRSPLGGHYGPDGALYVLNYDGFYSTINPSITRVDYVGACKVAVVETKPKVEKDYAISLSPSRLVVREAGRHEFTLFDIGGHKLVTLSGGQGAEYSFDKLRAEYHLNQGVHVVNVKTAKGLFVRNVSLL